MFGDWNKFLHFPNAAKQYIDVRDMSWKTQYHVPLTSIEVNGRRVKYNYDFINNKGGKAFFDSGTTFVYFAPDLFEAFTQ